MAKNENSNFSYFPEGRTYSPPRRGGGIACVNRALCEADAASAEALWTMPLCGAAVIVHADGCLFCFIIKTVVSVLETTRRLPASTLPRTNPSDMFRSFVAVMGIASPATPIFFLRKRNKNEGKVRTNGNLPLGSQGDQQRCGTVCGCRFRLFKLYQYLK